MKSPSLAASAVVCAALLLAPPLVQGAAPPAGPGRAGAHHRPDPRSQRPPAHAVRPPADRRSARSASATSTTSRCSRPTPSAWRSSRPDLDKETNDLWVIEVATATGDADHDQQDARGRELAGLVAGRQPRWPTWRCATATSACIARRWRPAAQEELLFKNSAPLTLTDWSQDGRYLVYFSTDLTGGALFALPIDGDRRTQADRGLPQQVPGAGTAHVAGRRFVSFVSNSSGRNEVYVVPFDPAAAPGAAASLDADADLGSGRHRHGVLAA